MFGIHFPRFTQFNKLNDLLAATASGFLLFPPKSENKRFNSVFILQRARLPSIRLITMDFNQF